MNLLKFSSCRTDSMDSSHVSLNSDRVDRVSSSFCTNSQVYDLCQRNVFKYYE